MNKPYSNREIDQLYSSLSDKFSSLDLKMEQGFKGIYQRQDITNGRIKRLELWKAGIAGAIGILTFFVLPLVFLFVEGVLTKYL